MSKRLIAYVGLNHVAGFKGGGIDAFEISRDGIKITPLENGSKDEKLIGICTLADLAKTKQ